MFLLLVLFCLNFKLLISLCIKLILISNDVIFCMQALEFYFKFHVPKYNATAMSVIKIVFLFISEL